MGALDDFDWTEEEKKHIQEMKETFDFYRSGDGTNIDLVFPAFARALLGLPEPPNRTLEYPKEEDDGN